MRNGLGPKCPTFHNCRCWAYVPKAVDRSAALKCGWRETKATNRFFSYKDKLGRLQWFETGRINIWIKKPAHEGRKKQLLANAFFGSGLIKDIQIFEAFADSVRYKGAHAVTETGERLPYTKIDFLKDSLGVVVKTGDLSHPTSVEIEFHMPKWAEEAIEDRKAFIEIMKRLFDSSSEARPEKSIGVV
jgi:hypothetical protein